ncbi:MAG: hypothetical protein SOS24_03530 [Clostridia bacterium]|nr:hypothetical protein [Clostridia bacterium]
MLKLNPPTERSFLSEKPKSKKITEKLYLEKVPYSREEENVLLLDIAKYHVDDEPFSDEYEELLEINRIFKKKKTNIANNSTHPWAITPEPIKHHVKDIGIIAYLPYDLTVNNVKKGTFKLSDIVIIPLERLHTTNTKMSWFGPNAWKKYNILRPWKMNGDTKSMT